MTQLKSLLANISVSIDEFIKDPVKAIRDADDETVVVLNHNEPFFYAVSLVQYEMMVNLINDRYHADLVTLRLDEPATMTSVDELIAQTSEADN